MGSVCLKASKPMSKIQCSKNCLLERLGGRGVPAGDVAVVSGGRSGGRFRRGQRVGDKSTKAGRGVVKTSSPSSSLSHSLSVKRHIPEGIHGPTIPQALLSSTLTTCGLMAPVRTGFRGLAGAGSCSLTGPKLALLSSTRCLACQRQPQSVKERTRKAHPTHYSRGQPQDFIEPTATFFFNQRVC